MSPKEIEVTLPPRKPLPERIAKKIAYNCDICERDIRLSVNQKSPRHCVLCKRDLCRYRNENSCIRFDPEDSSDYPDTYCRYCYEIKYVLYKDKLTNIEEVYYKKLERIDQEVTEASLKQEFKRNST
jgi:hypothetical protein